MFRKFHTIFLTVFLTFTVMMVVLTTITNGKYIKLSDITYAATDSKGNVNVEMVDGDLYTVFTTDKY